MRKKALGVFWATCACLAAATSAIAAPTDIVLYAADAVSVVGKWTRVADATAAGGERLSSANKGWSSPNSALAAPAHYVEFSFAAEPNTPYHVWVRLRATKNNTANDSVYAQFSDAVSASGTALFAIGSTNALTWNLQTGSNAKLNGWGWVDGAYWLSQSSTLSFSGSGSHTLRLQTREDGVQVDQVVMSPATYLAGSPGQRSGDSTIIAKPATTTPPPSPTPYSGVAIALPGTIAAEAFDNGGEGVAYHDATAGNSGGAARAGDVDLEMSSLGTPDIGWIDSGEWVSYSVNVTAAGSYAVTARVASPYATGSMRVKVGSTTTAALSVPLTGSWQTWQDINWTMTLAAGPQILTLLFDNGGFNVAAVSVTTSIAPDATPSPTPTPTPTPTPAPAPAPTTGGTIRVPAGGDLQAAINSALPGDTILLQAGSTFLGNFTLPVKSGTGYVTIRTDIADPVPPGTRITPATAVNFAKIKSPNTYTALGTQPYAHHYILQLLEFPANVNGYGEVVALGDGGSAQNSLAMVPYELVLDRIYVHGDALGQKRGIGLNSASTTIRDSYVSNIWFVGQDSQAIAGWNGPGPYLITNNYLEGASENFLLGGSDPAILNLIPSDLTFTRNYVTKPLAWRSRNDLNVKNLFELKNAQRVTVDGNIFENNWLAAQAGYAIMITGRSQDGNAPWSVVKDLQFTNNIVRNTASGINILGKDYRFTSGTSSHMVFRNNLFQMSGSTYGGDGRFMIINGGVDITVDHNTILQDGYSVLYADTNAVQQFVMTNNIAPDNSWAIMGGGTAPGNSTIAAYFPNSIFLRGVWAGANPGYYPTGNYYPPSLADVGFVNLAGGDYHLAPGSIYRNAATDGTDVGANIDAILAATAGVK